MTQRTKSDKEALVQRQFFAIVVTAAVLFGAALYGLTAIVWWLA